VVAIVEQQTCVGGQNAVPVDPMEKRAELCAFGVIRATSGHVGFELAVVRDDIVSRAVDAVNTPVALSAAPGTGAT
jgi:hypothetical protein